MYSDTQPARRTRPRDLQRHPADGASPHDAQHPPVDRRRQEPADRTGVRAGDEHEDHRMVRTFHPDVGTRRLPRNTVVERADEQPDDRDRVHPHTRTPRWHCAGRRRRRSRRPRRTRRRQRHGVDDPRSRGLTGPARSASECFTNLRYRRFVSLVADIAAHRAEHARPRPSAARSGVS